MTMIYSISFSYEYRIFSVLNLYNIDKKNKFNIIKYINTKHIYSSACYIITLKHAKKIVNIAFPIRYLADDLMYVKGIAYGIRPFLCRPDEIGNTVTIISRERKKVSKFSRFYIRDFFERLILFIINVIKIKFNRYFTYINIK